MPPTRQRQGSPAASQLGGTDRISGGVESEAWSRGRTLRAALGTVVAASAAPYGYTISIWSSGAVLMGSHGTPRVAEVFAFLAGALTGFGLMALVSRGALARMEALDHAPDRVIAGAMHWLAAGAAVGAVALLSTLHGWEAWPLGSFAATSVYILGASVQLALVTHRRNREAA
jgi:hypothetical protein